MSDSRTIAIPERFDFSQHKAFTEQSNQLIQDEEVNAREFCDWSWVTCQNQALAHR